MKNWYHCMLGQVKGPFSLLQMEKLIEQKKIDFDDLIYQSGEKGWTLVKERWQFQKAILKRKTTKEMPKKDWVVLKQENNKDIEDKDICNYQYMYYSTEKVLKALHAGELSYSHWIWTYGMKDWKCIRNLPVFSKQMKVHNKKQLKNPNSLKLGPVTDVELYQSVMKAKPSSALISSLIDIEKKPNEAQGPNLTKQFGRLKFEQTSSSYDNKIHLKSSLNQKVQGIRPPDLIVSTLTQTKNKGHLLNKGSFIVSITFMLLCVFTYLFFPSLNTKLNKDIKNISLQYEVLHNGLELHFWIKQYAQAKVLLKIKNDKKQTLTANEFEHNIKLILDQHGHAVLRLDHLGLTDGYYSFLGQIDEDKIFRRRFFVGNNEQKFAYKLLEFQKARQQEKQKLEEIKRREIVNVIAGKEQQLIIPDSVEALYGQVRQLEKGYNKYNKNITKWRNFYSSWESSFNQLQSSALGYIKKELDLELIKELQTIEQELKVMGEQMDQSIKESHIEGFDPLSPQVAVFLEKMKINNRF